MISRHFFVGSRSDAVIGDSDVRSKNSFFFCNKVVYRTFSSYIGVYLVDFICLRRAPPRTPKKNSKIMISIVLLISYSIVLITVLATGPECDASVTDSGLKIEAVLGGIYLNASWRGVDGRNISNSVQRLDPTEPCHWVMYQATSYSPSNWAAGQSYFLLTEPSQIESLLQFYGDLEEVNEALQGKNLETEPTNEDIRSYGNLIVCNITVCPDMPRIGPSNNDLFMSHRPVAINTDFNLSNIVRFPSSWSLPTNRIHIQCLFYAIHNVSSDPIREVIGNELFPKAVTSYSNAHTGPSLGGKFGNDGVYHTTGLYIATYTDIERLNDDLGRPSTWNVTYNQYYLVPESDASVI
eukprot:511154_1